MSENTKPQTVRISEGVGVATFLSFGQGFLSYDGMYVDGAGTTRVLLHLSASGFVNRLFHYAIGDLPAEVTIRQTSFTIVSFEDNGNIMKIEF